MSKIILLVKKDYIVFSNAFGKSFYIIGGLILLLLMIFAPSMSAFYGALISYMLIVTLFNVEENQQNANMNNLLPVTRTQVVIGRYVYGWSVLFISSNVVTVTSMLSSLLLPGEQIQPLMNFALIMGISLLMMNLYLPAIFRWGILKAKVYIMVVYAASIMVTSMGSSIFRVLSSVTPMLSQPLWGFLGIMILLSPLSLLLSIRWIQKR